MSCNEKNPLSREGTSLLNRVLTALSVTHARVDERKLSDLVLFAKRYAAYLNYYDSSNEVIGNWETLMKMNACVPLATLSQINVRAISDYKKLLYKNIHLSTTDDEAKKPFKLVFDCFFSLKKIIDDQYKLMPAEMEYKSLINDVITRKIAQAVSNLSKAYEEQFVPAMIDEADTELDSAAPLPVQSSADIDRTGWDNPPANILLTIPATLSPDTPRDRIIYIINHNLFNAQLEAILEGAASIVKQAEKLFEQTLEDFPAHSPHYALYLSFLKVFGIARDQLNNYTARHLDFYYKEVLQLENKNPEPDTAHLVFELQKPVWQSLLKKEILFKGGKDITGKEINYALDKDVVLNKAAIKKIQSLQIQHRKVGATDTGVLKASPVADSGDGRGGKITSTDKSWFTFGDPKKMNDAEVGFAISSNLFFLNEGKRTITVTFNLTEAIEELSGLTGTVILNCFRAKLTGKKDWHSVESPSVSYDTETKQLVFQFELSPDDPVIIPYAEKIHKEKLEITLPLVKFILKQDNPNVAYYTMFGDKTIAFAEVKVDVVGVKDLMLSNDTGSIDASKPFKPFGDFPSSGSGFYIGSKEIFQKNLSKIVFNYSPSIDFNNDVLYLDNGEWATDLDLVGDDTIEITGPFPRATMDFSANEVLKPTTKDGFIRLSNPVDLSQDKYMSDVTTMINATRIKKVSTGTNPLEYSLTIGDIPSPGEIKLTGFSVDYSATEKISFEPAESNSLCRFYHLNPFGYYEVPFASAVDSEVAEKNTLLPPIIHNGELFIGLENAEADLVINVLFQVADGSSNPLREMETVHWYYLAKDNNWREFEKQFIVDLTVNFTQSGVVTITLPRDISNQNTALEKGLYWIKAAVTDNVDAVCKMIMIRAQAASATLLQDEEKQIEFRQVLPSKSISKLVVSDATIKTIEQPFDSFGGRTRETDEHFYVRVSERLRHKQRAINIWDYEHIILEKFEKIFKVKCINHAGFYPDKDNKEIFCENYPGHVTIIPLPLLKNKTNINPLRPYTPIGLLKNIEAYLRTIISPFVKLHVRNPQFEEIRLDFKVQFHEHLDTAFYTQLLNTEIERFLCPWAFDEGVEFSFGGRVVKSVLLNFVEERPYVDYVTCFKMYQVINREEAVPWEKKDIEEAIPSTARSMLVSYFNPDDTGNERHTIVSPATCNC